MVLWLVGWLEGGEERRGEERRGKDWGVRTGYLPVAMYKTTLNISFIVLVIFGQQEDLGHVRQYNNKSYVQRCKGESNVEATSLIVTVSVNLWIHGSFHFRGGETLITDL